MIWMLTDAMYFTKGKVFTASRTLFRASSPPTAAPSEAELVVSTRTMEDTGDFMMGLIGEGEEGPSAGGVGGSEAAVVSRIV
jgi:hypothetical protein